MVQKHIVISMITPVAAQESNSTGNTQQETNATTTGVPENATSPNGSTVNNGTGTTPVNNSTGTTPVNNSTGNETADFVNSILAVHNRERAAVNASVPPLVWSDKLAADAKSWAEHLATTGKVVHCAATPGCDTHGEGENLADMSTGNPTTAPAWTVKDWASLAEMVWVGEKDYYQGKTATPPPTGATGHYTQMVWRDTKEVGCGTAIAGDHGILVCRYSPPGNIEGQKPY
jgi:uncharacterized protein YkwD